MADKKVFELQQSLQERSAQLAAVQRNYETISQLMQLKTSELMKVVMH